jgi:hypothetical protein
LSIGGLQRWATQKPAIEVLIAIPDPWAERKRLLALPRQAT